MARLKPNNKRSVETKEVYLGKVILFCEGKTEYNYFNHFAKILNDKSKYSHIDIKLEQIGSDAKAVLDEAEKFLCKNAKDYCFYDKYLVFDCDAPDNIQNVLNDMINSDNNYELLFSNLVFETWLVMHFEELKNPITKDKTYRKMANFLSTNRKHVNKYGSKQKASEGTIRKVLDNVDNVKNAIKNAYELENNFRNFDIKKDVKNMNPYTTIHKFIEKVLLEIKD